MFGLSADRDTYLFAGGDYDTMTFIETCYVGVRALAPGPPGGGPDAAIIDDLQPRARELLFG